VSGLIPCIAAAGGGFNPIDFSHLSVTFWTIVIFLLALYPMIKFVFGPIARALDAQDAKARKAVTDAEAARDEAGRLKGEMEERLAGLREQEEELLAQARTKAEEAGREIQEKAKIEGERQLERARRAIAQEEARARAELRREVVDLTITAAGKVVGRSLTDGDQRSYVADLVQGLGPAEEEGRGAS